MYFLIAILIMALLYLLSIRGRVGFTDFKDFRDRQFAHRGLFGNGIPENSLSAFKNAKAKGFGAEFDVHLTADGDLAVIHDHSLMRTVGADLNLESLTLSEIQKFTLEGTEEIIPSFREVLEVYGGEYPLIIELKATKDNVEPLCKAVVSQLKDYKGAYCIESFDPRVVMWFKKNCPDIVRGQLAENYFKNKDSKLSFWIKLGMSFLLTNFLTKPDFTAYNFAHRSNISFRLYTKLWREQGIVWTVKTKEDIVRSLKEKLIPIFEDRN